MKRLLTILLLIPCFAFAGTKYTYGTTSGDVTISPSSTSPSLTGGDTLDIPANGNYGSMSFNNLAGSSGNYIVIRFLSGSVISNAATFAAGAWTTCSFVKVIGMYHHNFLGNAIWFRYANHDIILDSIRNINDYGNYSEKQAIRMDDNNVSNMNFDGTKAKTFYNIEIKNSTFKGFKNVNVITVGSDDIRSITTDLYIHHSSFLNLTSSGIAPAAVEGTCFNCEFAYNTHDSMMATGSQGVHTASYLLYGWFKIHHNRFSNSYCNDVRANPIRWTGLSGYGDTATAKVLIYNNLSTDHLSFSFAEISNNNSGSRFSNISGTDTAKTFVYHNTVYKTKRASYNGDYHGCIVDLIAHYVRVYNNIIIRPEYDFTYDPNAGSSRYVVAYISGNQPGADTLGNYQYKDAASAGWDSTNNRLLSTSPVIGRSVYTGIDVDYDILSQQYPGNIDQSKKSGNTSGAIQGVLGTTATRQEKRKNILIITR